MERTLKVILVGDAGVGKTSFVQRYVDQSFLKDYKATIGVDFSLKIVRWTEDITLKVQLWDIAGQERYHTITRVYFRDAHACVIMFDMTKHQTFRNVINWKKDIENKCHLPDGSPVPCMLVANKCDLAGCEVEYMEMEEMCRNNSFIGFFETSVKENLMVDESMGKVLEEIMAKQEKLGKQEERAAEHKKKTIRLHSVSKNKHKFKCSLF